MFFFPKGQNATSKDVQDFVECHLFCALQSIVGKEDQWTVGANVVVFGKKVLQMSYPCWNWHFRTCWNTIVSFWGPAYFSELLLLVSGSVNHENDPDDPFPKGHSFCYLGGWNKQQIYGTFEIFWLISGMKWDPFLEGYQPRTLN